MFSYVETHLEEMLARTQGGGYLISAVEFATRAAFKEPNNTRRANGIHLSTVRLGEEVVQAIEQIKGISCDDATSVAIGVALMSALSVPTRKFE